MIYYVCLHLFLLHASPFSSLCHMIQVDYSDPGELSITQIHRGVAEPADVCPSKASKTNNVKPKTVGTAAGKSGGAQVQMQEKPQAQKQAPKLEAATTEASQAASTEASQAASTEASTEASLAHEEVHQACNESKSP